MKTYKILRKLRTLERKLNLVEIYTRNDYEDRDGIKIYVHEASILILEIIKDAEEKEDEENEKS